MSNLAHGVSARALVGVKVRFFLVLIAYDGPFSAG